MHSISNSQLFVVTTDELSSLMEEAADRAIAKLQPPKDYVDKKGIAAHFGVSVHTINRWMKAGLPHDKIGSGYPHFSIRRCEAWRCGNALTDEQLPPETKT